MPRPLTDIDKTKQTRAKKVEDRLREILKDLQECQLSEDDIMHIKQQLCEIDELIVDSAVHEKDGSIEPGQAIISELLNKCHELSSEKLEELEA
ncbi:hypothetical protein HK100_002531 [Physocladia obscura]|uniref:Uncharacterized protein n=1 Tax=Physocladia obscura TaxID=109957 RepID=A0AAD5XB07_9FUNG|nr:hypothetical protein HK100_002531 [Physocladia obscura]